MTINEENLRACTAAMRSGEFPQSKHRLRNANDPQCAPPAGWCCLGIIHEVYRRATGNGEWRLSENGKFYLFDLDGDIFVNYLAPAVMAWLGVEKSNPVIGSYNYTAVTGAGGHATFAAEWNDAGVPLDKIADAFEATFLEKA